MFHSVIAMRDRALYECTYMVLTGIFMFIQPSCFFNQERNLIIIMNKFSPSVPKSDETCKEIFEIAVSNFS